MENIETTEPAELPPEIVEAIKQAGQAAEQAVSARYAGFPFKPEIYTVTVCGITVVCLPFTLAQRDTWLKKTVAFSDADRVTRGNWELLREVLYWVQGMGAPAEQLPDQQAAAFKRLKAIAEVGGSYAMIGDKVANEYMRMIDTNGGKAAGKKL